MRISLVMGGGGGTRLWPASTPARPKQFMALGGDPQRSLLAAAAARAAAVSAVEHTFLVTTAALADSVRAAVPHVPARNIIAEPRPRSTAPCVLLALMHMVERLRREGCSEGQIDRAALTVLPADHHVGDEGRFAALLADACACASREGCVVVFGVTPTRPETGYGYIERGHGPPQHCGAAVVYPVERFVEKPDLARAQSFLASGRFLWNAGIFIMPVGRILAEYQEHAPQLWQALAPVAAALRQGQPSLAAARTEAAYAGIEPTSIDVTIMERLGDLQVAAADVAWTDLGSWAAIREALPRDAAGNAVHAESDAIVHLAGSRDGLVWTDGPDVAVVGLDGVAVIACGDRVLVCPLERAQEVRAAAEAFAARRACGERRSDY